MQLVLRARLVLREPPAHRARLDHVVLRVYRAQLVRPVLRALLEWLALKGRRGLLV